MTPRWEPLNAARNWYPKTYQRFPEILRTLGASGLMAIPTEADVEGAAHDDVAALLPVGDARRARARAALPARLGPLDVVVRRPPDLYEYFFFGDPVRMAGALVAATTASPTASACARSWRATTAPDVFGLPRV